MSSKPNWNDDWCRSTMGGSHHLEDGVCMHCRKTPDQIEKEMVDREGKEEQPQIQGYQYMQTQTRAPIMQQQAQQVQSQSIWQPILQVPEGGFTKHMCSATMGGRCDIGNDGKCKRCHKLQE